MRTLISIAITLLFATISSAGVVPSVVSRNDEVTHRLDPVLIPSDYTIRLRPNFDTGDERAFTFEGEVTIRAKSNAESQQIALHSVDLRFQDSDVTVTLIGDESANSDLPLAEVGVEFDSPVQFVYINLASILPENSTVDIHIAYTADLRNDMLGFYLSSYRRDEETRYLAATQLGLTYARMTFPCFDEPHLKAVFHMSIERPTAYNSLFNTQLLDSSSSIGNGLMRDDFQPTPLMSTYLIAFLVSDFEAGASLNEGSIRRLGIWSRPGATGHDYALEVGEKIINALGVFTASDYFTVHEGIDMKLDHVAIPDFSFGAMENWGLMKYRELSLLYDESESNVLYKQRVTTLVSHETAHAWFGNLVTCHWWSDAWLNEGFAVYFENMITAEVEPRFGTEEQFVMGAVHTALASDQSPSSTPISNLNVDTAAQVLSNFGAITYSKAASIIRMVQHYIGAEAFQTGIRNYINARQFSTGTPSDVYTYLQSGVGSAASLPANVETVMSSWITQAGYPLLTVTVNYGTGEVQLRQSRYVVGTSTGNPIYQIPISYATEISHDFADTTADRLMTGETDRFSIDGLQADSWIVFNKQQTGFYRVNYDDTTWQNIYQALRSEKRTTIHRLNRGQIVNDVFAFLNNDLMDFKLAFEILDFLAEETDYYVWGPAIAGFTALRNTFRFSPDAQANLDAYILNLLTKVIDDLGYADTTTELNDNDYVRQKNRMQLLQFACNLGHEECIQQTTAVFHQNSPPQVPSNLRPVAYCNALRTGGDAEFEAVWQLFLAANVINDRFELQTALGCTASEMGVNRYLDEVISENSLFRNQDLSSLMPNVMRNPNNSAVALQHVQDHLAGYQARYGGLFGVFSAIVSGISANYQLTDLLSWALECTPVCTAADVANIRSAVTVAQTSITWASENEESLKEALVRNNAGVVRVSWALVVTVTIFALRRCML